MNQLGRSMDYDDPILAEIFDRDETSTEDVDLIRKLIQGSDPLNILECFSGTGRILIPLACDGHRVTGIEIAEAMNARAASNVVSLTKEIQDRIALIVDDVLGVEWGKGYDVVIFGGNCLYELPSPEAQEECIRRAAEALVQGGYLFIDSTDGSGYGADPSEVGTEWIGLEGTTVDGTYGKLTARVVRVDADGVAHFVRTWYQRRVDGTEKTVEYAACKYPVSGREIEVWLRTYGFEVLERFGGATFWARIWSRSDGPFPNFRGENR